MPASVRSAPCGRPRGQHHRADWDTGGQSDVAVGVALPAHRYWYLLLLLGHLTHSRERERGERERKVLHLSSHTRRYVSYPGSIAVLSGLFSGSPARFSGPLSLPRSREAHLFRSASPSRPAPPPPPPAPARPRPAFLRAARRPSRRGLRRPDVGGRAPAGPARRRVKHPQSGGPGLAQGCGACPRAPPRRTTAERRRRRAAAPSRGPARRPGTCCSARPAALTTATCPPTTTTARYPAPVSSA